VQKLVLLLILSLSYFALAQEIHTYGPLKKGESLWQIAAKISPSPIHPHQVILALQKINPHAFKQPCNVNSLKINQVLRIPSLSQMQVLSQPEAIKELNRQNQAWKVRYQQPIVCPTIVIPPPPLSSSIQLLSSRANNDMFNNKSTLVPVNNNSVYEKIYFPNYSTSPSFIIISILIIIGLLAAVLIDWLLHKYVFKKQA
jgi:FimV-like protein